LGNKKIRKRHQTPSGSSVLIVKPMSTLTEGLIKGVYMKHVGHPDKKHALFLNG
jgi:hypothetical protein